MVKFSRKLTPREKQVLELEQTYQDLINALLKGIRRAHKSLLEGHDEDAHDVLAELSKVRGFRNKVDPA